MWSGCSEASGGREKETLNQWECGELSRNFIRLQVCASAPHPEKRRQTSAELTSSAVSEGKSRVCRWDPATVGFPSAGTGTPGWGASGRQKLVGFRWLALFEVRLWLSRCFS